MTHNQKINCALGGLVLMFVAAVGAISYRHCSITEQVMRQDVAEAAAINDRNFDHMWKFVRAETAEAYRDFGEYGLREYFKFVYYQIMTMHTARATALVGTAEYASDYQSGFQSEPFVTAVEAMRVQYQSDWDELVLKNEQHNAYLDSWPATLFLGFRPRTEIGYDTYDHEIVFRARSLGQLGY